jgi:hypothetical protein
MAARRQKAQQEPAKSETPTKAKKEKKPVTLWAHKLNWRPAEWAEEGQTVLTAQGHGYELIVEPVMQPDEKAAVPEGEPIPMVPTGRWSWQVRSTSEVSETPELIDRGTRASESGAKIVATECVNKLARRKS